MKVKFIVNSLIFSSLFVILSSFVHESDRNIHDNFDVSEFFYINADNGMNLSDSNGVYSPFLGIGCRQIYGEHGLDWNLGTEIYPLIRSKFKLFSYSINCNYIKFFEKQQKNKYYFGVGASLVGLYTPDFLYILKSPTFLLGRQIYEGDRVYI